MDYVLTNNIIEERNANRNYVSRLRPERSALDRLAILTYSCKGNLKIGWKLQMTIACYAKCNVKHFYLHRTLRSGALFGLCPPHLSCSTATFAALQLLIQRSIQQAAGIRRVFHL